MRPIPLRPFRLPSSSQDDLPTNAFSMALELAQKIVTARQAQAQGSGTPSGVTIHKVQSGNTTVDVGGDYGYTLPNLELMVPALHKSLDVEVEDDTLKIRDEALFRAVKTAVEPWDDYLESDEGVRQLLAGEEGDSPAEVAESIADDVGEDIAEDVIEDVSQGQSLDKVAESRGMSRDQLIAQLEAAGFDVTTIKPTNKNGDVEGVEIRETPADEGAEPGKLIVGSYDDHHNDARTTRYTDVDGNEVRRVEYADGEISESVSETEGTETTTVTKPDGTVVETVIEPNGRRTTTTTEPPEDGEPITHEVKPSESLSEIASQYEGVKGWQDLEPDNRDFFSDRNPNLIHPGEEIVIGGGPTTVEVTNNGYTLTTDPGGEMTLTDDVGDMQLQIEKGTPGEKLVQTLLALDLDDSNPQQEREAKIVKTAVEAYLAEEHQATAAHTAQDRQKAKLAVIEEYGQGQPATPTIEKDEQGNEVVNLYGNPSPGKAPSGGNWVLMNGTWMDPKVAEAIVAENIALIELAEAQTNAEQKEATLDIYALNSDYGQAMDNAKSTLDEALLPYGLSWVKPNPSPQETLADTRNRRDDINTRLESLGEIKGEYEKVQSLLEDAEKVELPEQKLPRPPLAAGHHPLSFTRYGLEGDLEDAQDEAAYSEAMALFSNIAVHMTRGDKKFSDYQVDVLRQERSNTEPESDRYKELEKEIAKIEAYRESAAEGLELEEAHSEFLTTGAKARKYDAQAIDLKQRIFEQYVSENLDFIKLDDPEHEYRRGGGDPLGKLVKVEVVEREEEGHQLWLVMTFEHGTDERQLTFDPDVGGVDIDVGEERINDPLNQAWQELLAGEKKPCNNHELGASDNSWIGASENELSVGERFHRILAEQATTKEDLTSEIENLEDNLTKQVKPDGSESTNRPEEALPVNIEPVAISIADQDVQVAPEVAANYEQYGMDALINSDLLVRIQVENDDKEPEWRWVDPEAVSTRVALDTARDQFDERLDKAENFRNTVEEAADKFEFYQTQPLKLMEDSESTQHSADLDNTYLDEHRDQALDAYELQFQAFFDKGYNGKFRSLTENRLEAVVTQEFGINTSPRSVMQEVQRIGGDTPEVTVVKFFYLDPHFGEQQHSLIAVKDSEEKTYYVDAMGMKFSSLEDFQDNNRQFSENGRLVVPRNLEMKPPDENGRISLDVIKARNVSLTEKVTDRAVTAATTVATATSFFVPGAAPIAVLGSAYLIGRSGYQLYNYMAHGGERGDSESWNHALGMVTNSLPMMSNAARTFGIYSAYKTAEVPMSLGTALRASMGGVRTKSATFNLGFRRFHFEASPHAGNINSYYTSSSLSNLFARETDKWAIGAGTLLMARELDRIVAHGYQMSSIDLWNAWLGLGTGFVGSGLGIRGLWMTRPDQLSSPNGPHSGPRANNETQGSPNDPTGNGPNEGPDAGMIVYEVGSDGVYRPTDERAPHDPSKPVIRHEDIPDSDAPQTARTTRNIAALPARDHQELEIYSPPRPSRSQPLSPVISESVTASHNGPHSRHSYRTIQVNGEPVEVKFLSGQSPKSDENVYVLQEGGPRVSAEELVATGKTHVIGLNPNTQEWEGVQLVLGASEDHVFPSEGHSDKSSDNHTFNHANEALRNGTATATDYKTLLYETIRVLQQPRDGQMPTLVFGDEIRLQNQYPVFKERAEEIMLNSGITHPPSFDRTKTHDNKTFEHDMAVREIINQAMLVSRAANLDAKSGKFIDEAGYPLDRSRVVGTALSMVAELRGASLENSQNLILRDADHYLSQLQQEWQDQGMFSIGESSLTKLQSQLFEWVAPPSAQPTRARARLSGLVAWAYDAKKVRQFKKESTGQSDEGRVEISSMPAAPAGGRRWAKLGARHFIRDADIMYRQETLDALLHAPILVEMPHSFFRKSRYVGGESNAEKAFASPHSREVQPCQDDLIRNDGRLRQRFHEAWQRIRNGDDQGAIRIPFWPKKENHQSAAIREELGLPLWVNDDDLQAVTALRSLHPEEIATLTEAERRNIEPWHLLLLSREQLRAWPAPPESTRKLSWDEWHDRARLILLEKTAHDLLEPTVFKPRLPDILAATTSNRVKITTVFRGDTRGPDMIFHSGFQQRGESDPYVGVSTSLSSRKARKWAEERADEDGAWVYTIFGEVSDGDIFRSLPARPQHRNTPQRDADTNDYEIQFSEGIAGRDILSARRVDSDGNFVEPPVYNPRFKDPARLPENRNGTGPQSLSAAYLPDGMRSSEQSSFTLPDKAPGSQTNETAAPALPTSLEHWFPGRHARQMISKSPTLRLLYEEATQQYGVKMVLGPEGDGTYYSPQYNEIVIDRTLATQPNVLLIALAHELSHAVSHQRGNVSSARPGALLTATPGRLLPVLRFQGEHGVLHRREDMRSEAVETAVDALLQDEGAAALNALQVRDEWLRAGETLADDVTDPAVTWDAHVSWIYEDYRDGRLSWQEATVNLGKIIEDLPTSDKESVSYGYDYRQQEHDYYDAKEAERWQAGVSSSPQSGSRPGGPSTFMAARSPGARPTGPESGSASQAPQAKAVYTSTPPEGQPRLYRIDDLDALGQAVSSGEIPVGNFLHVIRSQRAADTFTLNDGKVPYSGRIQDNGRILWPAGRTGQVDGISVTTPNAEGRQVIQVRSEGADGQRTHYVRSNDDVYIVVTELSANQVRERFRSGSGLLFAEYSGMGAWNVPGALPVTQQVSVFTPKPFKPLDSTLPQSQKNVLENPKTGNVTSLPPKRDGNQNAIRAVLVGVGGIGASLSLAAPPHISTPLNAVAMAVRGASLGLRSLAPDKTAVDTVRGRVHRGIEFVTLAINNPNSATQLTEMESVVDTSSSALFVGGNTLYFFKTFRESVTGQPFMPWADDFALPMFGIGSGLYTASSGVDLWKSGGVLAAGHTAAGTLFGAGSTLLWFRDSHIGKKVRPFKSSEPAQSSESSPKKRDIVTVTTFGPGLLAASMLAASSLFADEEEKPSDDTTPAPPNTDEPLPSEPDDSNRTEPTPPENEEPKPDATDETAEDGEHGESGRFNPDLKDSAVHEEIVVQPGQTMGGIAVGHGHDIAEVVELNMGHIPDPSLLYPGDRVYLPR